MTTALLRVAAAWRQLLPCNEQWSGEEWQQLLLCNEQRQQEKPWQQHCSQLLPCSGMVGFDNCIDK